MSQTAIDIVNRALVRVGAARIASFDGTSAEAECAGAEYEPLVRARLTEHRWRFATAQAVLNLLVDTPAGRWAHAWQAPAGALQINAVTRGGLRIRYDRYGDKIFTDEGEDLLADYTFRPDESLWPPYFSDALADQLAYAFALSLARDEELARILGARLDRTWARARLSDSQQQSTRRIAPSRFVSVRH